MRCENRLADAPGHDEKGWAMTTTEGGHDAVEAGTDRDAGHGRMDRPAGGGQYAR
jgi:hypothetical protein